MAGRLLTEPIRLIDMHWQTPLPAKYYGRGDDQLAAAIAARKAEFGDRLIILGHHYQQDEVIQFADFTGDSFKLSAQAAERVVQVGARHVIFAGVHFMAESADILTPDDVAVMLPDLGAGCSMADMADYDQTVEAWEEIHRCIGADAARVIPVCYMNSSAAIKAFCGEHGGAVCTSSNCDKILKWALAGGNDAPITDGRPIKILFLPDQHLGRNTAEAIGFDPVEDMAVWDPNHIDGMGGLDETEIHRATFLLWKGHCSVHMLFRAEHVDQVRTDWPDVTVIVHPECTREVVQKADLSGSTEGIIRTIESAQPGTRWAVGTEVHMVNRLARNVAQRGVQVRMLSDCQCLCTTMYRIDMPHLLWVMDELAEGRVVNQITVEPRIKQQARVALDRMLQITSSGAAQPQEACAP